MKKAILLLMVIWALVIGPVRAIDLSPASFNPNSGGVTMWVVPKTTESWWNNKNCDWVEIRSGGQTYVKVGKNSSNKLVFSYGDGAGAKTIESNRPSSSVKDVFTDSIPLDINDWNKPEKHLLGVGIKSRGGQSVVTSYIDGFGEGTREMEGLIASGSYELVINSNCADDFEVEKVETQGTELTAAMVEKRLITPNGGEVLEVSPASVTVGTINDIRLRYKINQRIGTAGGLRLVLPHLSGWNDYNPLSSLWTTLKAGAKIDRNSQVGVKTKLFYYITSGKVIDFKFDEELVPGDVVEITLGGIKAPKWSNKGERMWFLEDNGEGYFYRVAREVRVKVVGMGTDHLFVIGPSTVTVGKPFEVTVRAEDVNKNLATDYAGRVSFSFGGEVTGILPQDYQFVTSDGGVKKFAITINTPGWGYVRVTDGNKTNQSFPMLAGVAGQENTYWGDIHLHSYLSDGNGDPEEVYRIARDEVGLDFASVVDHLTAQGAENTDARLIDLQLNEDEVAKLQGLANSFYQPEKFASIFGYEYRGSSTSLTISPSGNYSEANGDEMGAGDWNFYAVDSAFEPVNFDYLGTVWGKLTQGKVFAIPHHMGPSPKPSIVNYYPRLNFLDPRFVPVVDVARGPGRVELFGRSALSLGNKVGFVGSSDDHTGHPGRNVYGSNQGEDFMAVKSKSLTREALFEAVLKRKTYAASHKGMYLDFYVGENGVKKGEMGSEVVVSGSNIEIGGTVATAGGVESVTLIKSPLINNKEEAGNYAIEEINVPVACQLEGMVCSFKVNESLTDKYEKGAIYYVRFKGKSVDRMAWSSPIWVTKGGVAVAQGVLVTNPLCLSSSTNPKATVASGAKVEYTAGTFTSGWTPGMRYSYGGDSKPSGGTTYACGDYGASGCSFTVDGSKGKTVWIWTNINKTIDGVQYFCRGADSRWQVTIGGAVTYDKGPDSAAECNNRCRIKLTVSEAVAAGSGSGAEETGSEVDEPWPEEVGGVAGDASGDGKVDLTDLQTWKTEYLGDPGLTADFDKSGVVDMGDLKVWKMGYLK